MLAQRTTRPLRSLTAAVDAVAETRDFTVPVDASGNDEVGRLARGFDRMLRALDLSRAQQHRLVQDAAHELRTPLTSIKANVDWLRRAEDLDADARSATLAGVQRELDELNSVVSEIVELAVDGSDQPNFGPVDLADVADGAVTQFRARWDRPVMLRAEPCPVTGDAGALQRAITNLLTNAHKYSPAGAPIEVDVGPDGLWVSDHGEGIPEADRGRVVDRFFRREEHRGQPGSGLGLSIVTSIVNNHGGTVLVGEADGGGARVGFRLGQGSGLGRPVATATS
jgi:two-component system sensor histidine kinase MprB